MYLTKVSHNHPFKKFTNRSEISHFKRTTLHSRELLSRKYVPRKSFTLPKFDLNNIFCGHTYNHHGMRNLELSCVLYIYTFAYLKINLDQLDQLDRHTLNWHRISRGLLKYCWKTIHI